MQTNSDKYKWQSVLLFAIILIGLAFYFGLASLMFLSSVIGLVSARSVGGTNVGTDFIIASGMAFCGLSMLPALFFSFQRMSGKVIQPFQSKQIKVWQAIAMGTAWVGAVLLSDFLYQNFKLGWLVSAPFYAISIGLPLALLVWIGVGGIPLGSRNRFWSTLGIGMTVGPLLASLLELFVYIGILVILIFILALNPNWLPTIQQLRTQLHGMTDIDSVMQILAPYVVNPFVLISLFLILGVFTPLIEETIKPAVVWVMAKNLKMPSQGFALGVISGAGFALVESLLASSSPGQGWGELLAARAGGGLMHIFASGLMGWGIASAWKGQRLRLLSTYILSVSIHGLWNSAAIIIELGLLQPYLSNNALYKSLDSFSILGTALLGLLVLIILPGLILINRKLRQSIPANPAPAVQGDIIPPPKL